MIRLLSDDPHRLQRELLQRFRKAHPAPARPEATRRSVSDLLEGAERLWKQREQEEARRQAEAQERRLREVERKGEAAWRQVEAWIDSKQQTSYDQAVDQLKDLRELARRHGTEREVVERLLDIRKRHARKTSFTWRFDQAGLHS